MMLREGGRNFLGLSGVESLTFHLRPAAVRLSVTQILRQILAAPTSIFFHGIKRTPLGIVQHRLVNVVESVAHSTLDAALKTTFTLLLEICQPINLHRT